MAAQMRMRNLTTIFLLVALEWSSAFTPSIRFVRNNARSTVGNGDGNGNTCTRRTTGTRAFVPRRFHQTSPSSSDSSNDDDAPAAPATAISVMGLNELQTLLRDAVQREDYVEAGSLSDQLFVRLWGTDVAQNPEEKRLKRKRMSWRGLGAAPWLVNRLDSLNYTFPTTIQINTMESVNQILNTTDEFIETTTLEERIDMNHDVTNMGIVVSGSTGSGKTLSFLVPLLSTLSDSLFARQRLRVASEESVGDTAGDLVERISVVTSPVVRSNARKPLRQGSTIATGASLATLGRSGKDVKSPLALIVVPTRELGVQTAMLLYELIGGSIKKDPNDIRGKANMFKYKGPKGIRIGCVLDEQEAEFGLKLQTDVAITMPQYVGKLMDDGDLIPSKLRVVIYDEADLALELTPPQDLTKLFDDNPEEREYSRLTFMVGASVTESLGKKLVVRSHKILPKGKSYIATATRNAPLVVIDGDDDTSTTSTTSTDTTSDTTSDFDETPKAASLQDLDMCLDPGLIHQRVTIRDGNGLWALTRLVRKELEDYDEKVLRNETAVVRPRVVAFFPDEATAKASIIPLRDALWGEHRLCVLLPKTGNSPLQMMEQFKNDETTLMLATPNSVRGLDFPAVTHVYTLYLPMDDPREYVHLAGRVGRVGQKGSVRGSGGRVVSILKEEDAPAMERLSESLGFEFTDIEVQAETMPSVVSSQVDDDEDDDEDDNLNDSDVDKMRDSDVDKMRRYFEDTMNLLDADQVPEDQKVTSSPSTTVEEEDYDDEDYDDEIGFQ
jgi:superfamily II DNA/RNA helicase